MSCVYCWLWWLLLEQQKLDKKVSFFQGIKLTMQFRPYFYLVMMYMFGWVAISVSLIGVFNVTIVTNIIICCFLKYCC